MMTPATVKRKAARPTQAERTAISRDKVIVAAIRCLVSVGYAATSITLIASTAKMSIGRVQHQFSTKAEIMAAVIESIHETNNDHLSLRKLHSDEPQARVIEYIKLIQETFEHDHVLAAFEIRMAMKGDSELAAAVGPQLKRFDAKSFQDLEELLVATSMPRKTAHTWMRLLLATTRGLALERVASYSITNRINARQSLEMFINLVLERG
ncbi:TetR/AcrR family transcriptional regulator [Komagataeibacter swingsii]|nr:TetR/AcrR family transcriptional regulator [Komagataeibacter swingsii]GBQ56929.1 transcriptional regulator [Komagataeibacter swingsii DSM 16373]